MSQNSDIYEAVLAYIQDALDSIVGAGIDSRLKVEIARGEFGNEWTGIRTAKLPTASTVKTYIGGDRLVDFPLQIISKQSGPATDSDAIDFSSYLEDLAEELARRFRAGMRTALPDGVTLRSLSQINNSTLNFTDSIYTGYMLDMKFTFYLRRLYNDF